MVDIIAEGYDAGIRYGATVPQDMVAVPGISSLFCRHSVACGVEPYSTVDDLE